jgi:hypothetical protein
MTYCPLASRSLEAVEAVEAVEARLAGGTLSHCISCISSLGFISVCGSSLMTACIDTAFMHASPWIFRGTIGQTMQVSKPLKRRAASGT